MTKSKNIAPKVKTGMRFVVYRCTSRAPHLSEVVAFIASTIEEAGLVMKMSPEELQEHLDWKYYRRVVDGGEVYYFFVEQQEEKTPCCCRDGGRNKE